ncbi:MAG: lysozyme [Verrucomicrobiales bacterium]|nr:lysozyme [Verrucomicrobiales bacterium]|tara:strand:+ start:29162 stop:29638 length:477 start_codon:yes stop_codon:yes gene_type:complete
MTPKRITVHSSATQPKTYLTADDIRKMHLKRGWSDIGYHFVIRTDGAVERGRPLTKQGAHVYGHNKNNVGICLVGGIDERGVAEFNYSGAQLHALYALICELCEDYGIPYEKVCGHRDYSPDTNNDGKITPDEYVKECPCFDVRGWFIRKLQSDGVEL